MFNKNEKLDIKKLNNSLTLLNKILNIAYILIAIICIYIIILIVKEWSIVPIFLSLLGMLTPLFIGFVLAWLLEPFVKKLNKRGISRGISTIIVYVIFMTLIIISLMLLIPMLSEQINDFVQIIPDLISKFSKWSTKSIESFPEIAEYTDSFYNSIKEFFIDLQSNLPTLITDILKSLATSVGTFGLGLMVGFYMLFTFNDIGVTIVKYLPKKTHDIANRILKESDGKLRDFVQGMLTISFCLFIVASIILGMVGLKAPLLFGLIIGITDLIPYIGPYIGGSVAVIVGFTISPQIGIVTLIAIVVLQLIESMIFQPLIMSKTMKLHPVTIMIGLLIFGNFFGIVGMILTTPCIAIFKTIFLIFYEKYEEHRKKALVETQIV